LAAPLSSSVPDADRGVIYEFAMDTLDALKAKPSVDFGAYWQRHAEAAN
jgi:hypothetical protein